MLQRHEAEAALAYLVRPAADGTCRALPAIAYPPEYADAATGDVRLPVSWFWALFSAME